MTQEEKYKEALERASKLRVQNPFDTVGQMVEHIFPELAESEDEKIRKEIVGFITSSNKYGTNERCEAWLAWLEKQCQVKESIISQHEIEMCKENDDSLTSEDERIKETLKGFVKGYSAFINGQWRLGDFTVNRLIDWLEKQGEQHSPIDANKMVDEFANTEVKGYGIPSMIEVDAYRKGIEDALEKQGEGKSTIFIPKFRLGDKLVSTKNPRLTYEVLEVGHINKLGNPEYKVEIFTDGKAENPHNLHYMECCKVDEWAKLIEHKPADKVEPKFNVGDWVVNSTTLNLCHILKVEHGQYICDDCSFPITNENEYHLWTIQDAKDGDVLIASDGSIFLFAGVVDYACKYHVSLTTDNYVKINKKEAKGGYWKSSRVVYPATKEQCVLLFEKMKKADYEWDAEKKELKKMEVVGKE